MFDIQPMFLFIFNLNFFLIFIWIIFILDTLYLNYKMKYFFHQRKEEIFLAPFYVFIFFLTINIATSLIESSNSIANLNNNIASLLVKFLGILFCLLSISLYTYVNFFEKSFPSCMSLNKGKILGGIYNYIRHPSFHIYFFITFGSALCLRDTLLFIVACINYICLYFYYIIDEKRFKKIPYYEEYLKKTNRFLPRFTKIEKNK